MTSILTRSNLRNQSNQFQIESSSIYECGNFEIIETQFDGNCLFSAIFEFTERNKIRLRSPPVSGSQIRIQTVDYILLRNSIGFQQNWDRFYDNIKFNLESKIADLSKYGDNEKNDALIRQSYRDYMSRPGTFGTFTELCASAELYGFSGNIFQHTDSNHYRCYDFGRSNVADNKPHIYLLFTGEPDSGHFRTLQPLIAPTNIQPGQYEVINNQQSHHSSKISIKISSTEPPRSTQTFNCNQCNQSFGSKRGLASHRRVHIKETIPDETVEAAAPQKPSEPVNHTCDVCNQSFPTYRGMMIHRSRHASEANNSTAANLIKRTALQDENSSTEPKGIPTQSNKAALDSECKKWEKIFADFENHEILDHQAFDENIENFQIFFI